MTGASRIRALVDSGAGLHVPGVYDALSARLAGMAGFEALFLSGASAAAAGRAFPDLGYLSQTEMAEIANSVCSAADQPVLVDADAGYGNAVSAYRTARLFHAGGAAGLFLEDHVWPKRADAGRPRIVHMMEWLGKLRAVVELRDEGMDLYLVARTDAASARSVNEAIERGKAAQDIGVDAVFVSGLTDLAELEQVAVELEGVTLVAARGEGGPGGGGPGVEQLHELGYRIVVTPAVAVLAAARAVAEAMAALRRGAPDDEVAPPSSVAQLRQAIDVDRFVAIETRYR